MIWEEKEPEKKKRNNIIIPIDIKMEIKRKLWTFSEPYVKWKVVQKVRGKFRYKNLDYTNAANFNCDIAIFLMIRVWLCHWYPYDNDICIWPLLWMRQWCWSVTTTLQITAQLICDQCLTCDIVETWLKSYFFLWWYPPFLNRIAE